MANPLKFNYVDKKPTGAEGDFSPTNTTTPFGRAEERMAGREDFFEKAEKNITTKGRTPFHTILGGGLAAGQTFLGGVQRAEGLIANPAMEAQDLVKNIEESTQQVKETPVIGKIPFVREKAGEVIGTAKTFGKGLKSMYQALSGEKLGELGDVYTRAGAPEWLAKTLGLQNFFALSGAAGAVQKKLAGGVGHTDKLMNQQGKTIVTQVEGKLKQIRTAYDDLIKPYLSNGVSSNTVSNMKSASQNPKFIQKLINKYGSGVLDQFGNKTISVEGLRRMFWDVGAKKGKEFILVKNAIKDALVKQLPDDIAKKYLVVDKTFEKFIDPAYTILHHLKDKARIKTEVLSRFFKNPDHSGSRELLRSLKDFGMNIDDAIKTYTRYATREGQKKLLGRTAETALRWGILGSVLKGGKLGGKDDTMAPTGGGG